MSTSNTNQELDELTRLFQSQNLMIESLEKELNDLKLNSKTQADDPNAQLVKKLNVENDKLKYRINILKQSIEECSGAKSTSSTESPFAASEGKQII